MVGPAAAQHCVEKPRLSSRRPPYNPDSGPPGPVQFEAICSCPQKLIAHNSINNLQAVFSSQGTRFGSHKLCTHNFLPRFEKCGQL
jgi:hypothetical protein